MKYIKATDVLPVEILEVIQEYIDGEYIYIITAYFPNTAKFEDDLKTRKGRWLCVCFANVTP